MTDAATPTAVSDQRTHDLLQEVTEELIRLRGASLDDPELASLAKDDSLARLEDRLALLVEALEDIASRPIPAPVVEHHPDLPEELLLILNSIMLRLQEPLEAGLSKEALESLKRSTRPVVQASGSARTEVQVRNAGGTVIDPATNGQLVNINQKLEDLVRGVNDDEVRFDYDVRTDSNPVYIGKATDGTATSATSWTIQKFTYDGSDRVTRIEVVESVAWDDRTTSF